MCDNDLNLPLISGDPEKGTDSVLPTLLVGKDGKDMALAVEKTTLQW